MVRAAKVSNNKKRQINALVDQAAQAMSQGRFDVCEQLCLSIDGLQAYNADVASLRGVMAGQMGRQKQAVQLFRQAIEVAPRRCEFHANLAAVYLLQGKPEQAVDAYHRALELKPHQLQIQLGCASALIAMARYDEALTMMLAAHKRYPANTDVLMKLFRISYESDRVDVAKGWVQQVLAIDTDHDEAHYCYAMLLSESGYKQEAEVEVRAALRLNPRHADAALLLSALKKYTERNADVDLLASMYADTQKPADQIKLGFAYGKVLDDLGDYDEAFSCFEQANNVRSELASYNNDQELAHLQMVMQSYTPEVLTCSSDLDDRSPLFIVGMPRSGSTLIEQILAAHPDVLARGECGCFEDALALDSPGDDLLTLEKLTAYDAGQWGRVGENYLKLLQQGVALSPHYTDKSLTNIRLIGAIHCALPKARIIHVQRHPLDNCLSIYRQNLLGSSFDYGSKLGELGYYYRMYQQLMQHWRNVLPEGVLYEIDYQALVEDQEGQTRLLLEACDLPWDDRCLRFYEADNVVRTASFMQVRKPISASSVGVWKHYEKQLQPLIRILGVSE
ncbi:MAG: sulfotransferase [Mariprofundus sp.]